MPIVNVPGVGQLQFPDGMSQQDMAAAIQKNFPQLHADAPPATVANSTDGSSFLGNVAAGIGKGITDFGLGAKQALDDSAAYLEKHFGGESINSALGMRNAADIQRDTQAAVDEKRRLDAPLMQTGGGKVGNFIGTAVPAVASSLIPGMQGLAGTAASSAALGAVEPVSGDESRLKNMAFGTVGGVAGYGIGKGISRVVSPAAAANPELQALRDAGVDPTIGQTLGGMANQVEQKLQSLPIVGDGIAAARRRAVEQFNNAAINRATAPIGVTIDGVGQGAVKRAGDELSAAYNSALQQVPNVTLDGQFAADLSQLHGMSQNLVPPLRDKFDRVLNDVVLGRVSPQGSMLGETYKTVDSELGGIASKWQKSGVASESEFGDAVAQLKNLLDQNMRRSNPAIADRLASIDEGWANLVRIEQAAKSAHNTDGIFSPAQLASAVRMADDSTRGRAVARGTALMQDLSRAGRSVLGNTVPDSGTAGRIAAGGIPALAAGFVNPAIPVGLAAGYGAYSAPMQSILTSIASVRTAIAAPIGSAISNRAATAGALGAAAALALPPHRAMPNPIEDMAQSKTVGDAVSAAMRMADPRQ